jgi:hypothetical protein
LLLDAREDAPTHCLTLTTQKPWEELDPEEFRQGVAAVFKRLRRRLGALDYFAAVEFTTGKAASSGGRRRMHAHLLVKFRELEASAVDVLELERLVRETWKASTGAYVVEAAALVSEGAAIAYLGLHHRKPAQAPPAGWRGMIERASKGYWSRPIAELREQARRELRTEAVAWRTGMPVELAALEVELQAQRWAEHRTRVVKVRRSMDATTGELSPLLEPVREMSGLGDGRYRVPGRSRRQLEALAACRRVVDREVSTPGGREAPGADHERSAPGQARSPAHSTPRAGFPPDGHSSGSSDACSSLVRSVERSRAYR